MSNWPVFKALTNIVQKQIAKSQDTLQGRIISVNKANRTANVLVRRQSASGLAYPVADSALLSFSPEGSNELSVPDASAFKKSTFVIISDSNAGKIEKVYVSNTISGSDQENKLILSAPTQYSHQARTRVVGVNDSFLGSSVLSQNVNKGSQFIHLNDAGFIPQQGSESLSIRKKTFLKIHRKDEAIVDIVTVLNKNENQIKIIPALSYDFKTGDRVLASSTPDVDFDTQDEILLENISIQPNGGDYSYATVNQPVLLAAIEGSKSDLVIVGPSSAMNTSDTGSVNFDSKRFSVVIESVEEYTSDIVKQYDSNNNPIQDALIRKYDLTSTRDSRDLEDAELARKFKVIIGIRVPYEFLTESSSNQNWMYAIACGTEIDPPLDLNGSPVRALDVGGTGFSGFQVQGVNLNNFFYGLSDWESFSNVKNSKELLNLKPSRYSENFELAINLESKTFNPVVDLPPSTDPTLNNKEKRKSQYVYLKTFVIFNYIDPSHFYNNQGSTDDSAYKKLRSKNGQDVNFSIKVCAGRMAYISQREIDPIMPNIASFKITFKRKGSYRIDSNAVYPPRRNEIPISNDPKGNNLNSTGQYRGDFGWDLETPSIYDLPNNLNTHLLNHEARMMGDNAIFNYFDKDRQNYKLFIDLYPSTYINQSDKGIVYTATIKSGFYNNSQGYTGATPSSEFFKKKIIPAGTTFYRIDFGFNTGENYVLDQDVEITPQFNGPSSNFNVWFNKSELTFRPLVKGLNSFVVRSSGFESFLGALSGFFNWITGKYGNRERAIKKYKFGGFQYVNYFEDDIEVLLTEVKESRFKNYNPDRVINQTSLLDRIPSTRLPDFFRVNISLSVYNDRGIWRYDHFNRCTQYYRNNDESPWNYNLLGSEFDDANDEQEHNEVIQASPGNYLVGIGNGLSKKTMKNFHDKNIMLYSEDIDINNITEKSITYTAGENADTVGFYSSDYANAPIPYWQIVYPSARGQLIDIFGKYGGNTRQNRGIGITKCKVGTHCVINTTGNWSKGDSKVIFRFNLSPEATTHNYQNLDVSSQYRAFRDGKVRIVIQPVYSVNGKFRIGNSSVFFAETSNGKSFLDWDAGCYQASTERIF